MPKKPTTLHTIINELVDRTNSDTRRIRVLEQSGDSISSRLEAAEQEILAINQSILKINESLETGLRKRDAAIAESQSTIKEIIKQVKRLATTEKITELETMLDIYNPLKSNFMTREEVEQLIEDKLTRSPKNIK